MSEDRLLLVLLYQVDWPSLCLSERMVMNVRGATVCVCVCMCVFADVGTLEQCVCAAKQSVCIQGQKL